MLRSTPGLDTPVTTSSSMEASTHRGNYGHQHQSAGGGGVQPRAVGGSSAGAAVGGMVDVTVSNQHARTENTGMLKLLS